eukprot:2436823-Prymnesium_polylepis.1
MSTPRMRSWGQTPGVTSAAMNEANHPHAKLAFSERWAKMRAIRRAAPELGSTKMVSEKPRMAEMLTSSTDT